MTQGSYIVRENRPLTDQVYRMRLAGDTAALTRPGQFVNIRVEGAFLRRPLSVCDWDADGLTVIYKTVGEGTRWLSRQEPGKALDLLCGLGNGFSPEKAVGRPLLCGGGVGAPPLFRLCRELCGKGLRPVVVLGFGRADEVFLAEEFAALGADVTVTTVDGSAGVKGLVTDALPENPGFVYACGPIPMLRAVAEATACGGEYSFEERMGCGFGACMGCTCKTKDGQKRICKEGPVLAKEEIVW